MNIILAGDSWACGEWGRDAAGAYRVLHPGLERYLQWQGHDVLRVAQPADTNPHQLALVRPEVHGRDLVVFVQTDPLRGRGRLPGCPRALHRARRARLRWLYRGLHGLACPVLLVGGNSAVARELVPRGPIRVVTEDWIRELGVPRPARVICRSYPYGPCEPELLAEWELEEQRLDRFRHRCRTAGTPEHRWFSPDIAHPNRLAHRWLSGLIQGHIRDLATGVVA